MIFSGAPRDGFPNAGRSVYAESVIETNTPPTASEQVKFLRSLQRLLDETRTTSTYKFALLLALADLSVEYGDDSGAPLPLTTTQVASKFLAYYWQHVVPFETASGKICLRQNPDRPPRVLTEIGKAREEFGASLTSALGNRRLLARIEQTVRGMPLTRLQKIGRFTFDFLYADTGPTRELELRPGVAFCFRRFHNLIQDLIRGAWLRFVRDLNAKELGTKVDLGELLFGSRRADLAAARSALVEAEGRICFFCGRDLVAETEQLDHFIPWSRYPRDLGHNLVLSDIGCNRAKGSRLPAVRHLYKWVKRNRLLARPLEDAFVRHGVLHDLAVTLRITHWAYSETAAAEGLSWDRSNAMIPLAPEWTQLLHEG